MLFETAAATLLLLAQGAGPQGPSIEALGQDEPAAREEASSSLLRAGRAAWPALERAAGLHPDAEVRARARDLLDRTRLRRQLSFRIMDLHPSAPETLGAGATPAKLDLIRTMGRNFQQTSGILADLALDRDPFTAVAAAEILHEHGHYDWAPHLLAFYARERCPREARVYDLLAAASSRIPIDDLNRLFHEAGPGARARLVRLAVRTNLALGVDAPALRALFAGDASSRIAALAWVRRAGFQKDFPEAGLLEDPDPEVIVETLRTLRDLGRMPPPATTRRLLGHENASVREEAARAAGSSALPGFASELHRLLEDPSTLVRQTALEALAKAEGDGVRDAALEVYLRDDGEPHQRAFALLLRAGEWTLPHARALVRDPRAEHRRRGYALLARLEAPAVLAKPAGDADDAVRRWALEELSRVDLPGTLETLARLAHDSSESIRFEAVRALVRRGESGHLDGLRAFLASGEYTLRYDATEALLAQEDEPADTLARRLSTDPDVPIRRLAWVALAERGDASCAGRALEDLGGQDGQLQRSAALYFEKLFSRRRDPDLAARLAGRMESLEGEPLALAFRLVTEHGDASAAEPLRHLVRAGRAPDLDSALRVLTAWAGPSALDELLPLLGADARTNDLVFARVRDLRSRGRGGLLQEAMERLAASPDRRVRGSAAAAAGDLDLPFESLCRLVGDAEPSVRHAAIVACARLGADGAAPLVEARLDDDDPEVRVAAAACLSRLRPEARPGIEEAAAREECEWARQAMDRALRGAFP